MIASIHQPHYLPWLGYFHRIAVSDVHIVLDHVQFEKNSFVNRNRVRTQDGWTWLTVPVRTSGEWGNLEINGLQIATEHKWRSTHWKTLKFGYANAPYFPDYADFLEKTYSTEWMQIIELIQETTGYLRGALGIDTKILRSSQLDPRGTKSDLILDLCQAVDASVYLSGPNGRDYLDEAAFREAGVQVTYQEYTHPTYEQVHPGFQAKMSALDLLLNHGDASADLLMRGNRRQEEILEAAV